jgi:hypothetical protein
MNKLLAGCLLIVVLPACGSDEPLGAAVTLDVTMDSPLARLEKVSLIRAGDSFTLAGYDAGVVRWGRLSLAGELTAETSFPLAQPVLGPVFAVTKKNSPGDQLIALALVTSTTVSGGYDLMATTHALGDPAPAAPIRLSAADWFPTGTDPGTVMLIAGAAASGNVGYVAWGIRANHLPVNYLLLPTDAVTAAAPSTFLDDPVRANVPAWDCLAPQSRPTGLSFGVVTPDSMDPASDFHTVDIDENGATAFMTYPLTAAVKNCLIVGTPVTTSGRYYMALQGVEDGTTAIDFAIYNPKPDPNEAGTVNTHHPALSAAVYGDLFSLPTPAWVTAAGTDVVLGLARKSGPEIVRFAYNNIPHGSKLTLRSANGQAGAVAAWVGDDAVYVTYSDQVKEAGAMVPKRYFMRIVSPAVLP